MNKFIAALSAALVLAPGVQAQDYPDGEVTLLVNYGAGGAVDRTARSVQPYLPDALGTGVIVENVGGAGGKVGLGKFLAGEPDGQTVLTAFAPATTYVKHTSPGLFEMDDLAVINVQWVDPAILLANKNTGWTSLADMIEAVRANPGDFSFGSSGQGSVGPILAEALFDSLDLDIKSVPYSGGGDARRAFASGEVDLTAAGAEGALAMQGEAVPLAVFWREPVESWPDAPTIEVALEGYDVEPPVGGAYRFFAVHSEFKETEPEKFATLVEAFRKVTQDSEDFLATAGKSGVGTMWTGPEEGQAMIEQVDAYFAGLLAAGSE